MGADWSSVLEALNASPHFACIVWLAPPPP